MQCTLLIPYLCWPHGQSSGFYENLAVPGLQEALCRARRTRLSATSTHAWLCQAFEVERQNDWPVAPVTLIADGGTPGTGYWLRADPVHLQARRDRLLLADSRALSITHDEARALLDALNAHFAPDGLRFQALHPQRWYVSLDEDPGITTHAPEDVAGDNVHQHLPQGKNALRWHAIHNEIQMLLHDHPVNEAREERGDLPVNSVWFWGGGRRPRLSRAPYSAMWSDDALALGLAASAGLSASALPVSGDDWLKLAAESSPSESAHLVVIETLARSGSRGDLSGWREAVMELDRQWLTALCNAVRERVVSTLTLVTPGPHAAARYELSRADLWKFWRRLQPLAACLPDSLR